jgi:ribosome-associated heat shock protein Hsp15
MSKVRLDKWLWAARFFRTRAKAKLAIEGGKVHIGGVRTKASKEIQIGDELVIRQGWDEKTVIVTGLSSQRGNAAAAGQIYTESSESIARREALALQRKSMSGNQFSPDGRPTKRQRRQIHQFKEKNL